GKTDDADGQSHGRTHTGSRDRAQGTMPVMAGRNQSTCATCGAPQGNVAPLYCRFCGARKAGGVEAGFRTDPERYELVTREPAYAGAMRHAPRLGWGDAAKPVALFLFATAIAAAGATIAAAAKAGTAFTVAFVVI